jgi:hypothetical protein
VINSADRRIRDETAIHAGGLAANEKAAGIHALRPPGTKLIRLMKSSIRQPRFPKAYPTFDAFGVETAVPSKGTS